MNYNEQSEKILTKALELLERGKSKLEILNLFPEQKDELRELFQTMETVQSTKNGIRPPEELLRQIISQIPDERTEHQENHLSSFGFSTWFKFAIPAAAIAILVAVFYSKLLPKESQKIAEQTTTPVIFTPIITDNSKNKKTPSPEPTSLATNDIDTLINEAIALTNNQQSLPDENADTSLINSDDQALNDFSQFYNEEEL